MLKQLMPEHHEVGSIVPLAARQGRQNQRYSESGERLVAGCIPVRFVSADGDAGSAEVLLISSSRGNGWVFPKGGWELDESAEAAARRETVEESGVRGVLDPVKLGEYPYSNRKQSACSAGCIAHMYVMHVKEELSVWPESHRIRTWLKLPEAIKECRHQWMRDALHDWINRQGWNRSASSLP